MLKIITLIFPFFLIASDSLVDALKKNNYQPKDSVIITPPKNILKKRDENIKVNDLDFLLLQKKTKKPMHPLNKGVLKFMHTQKSIESDISKNIKKLFFLPKDIKVKSTLNKNKIETKFIYIFKD